MALYNKWIVTTAIWFHFTSGFFAGFWHVDQVDLLKHWVFFLKPSKGLLWPKLGAFDPLWPLIFTFTYLSWVWGFYSSCGISKCRIWKPEITMNYQPWSILSDRYYLYCKISGLVSSSIDCYWLATSIPCGRVDFWFNIAVTKKVSELSRGSCSERVELSKTIPNIL